MLTTKQLKQLHQALRTANPEEEEALLRGIADEDGVIPEDMIPDARVGISKAQRKMNQALRAWRWHVESAERAKKEALAREKRREEQRIARNAKARQKRAEAKAKREAQ